MTPERDLLALKDRLDIQDVVCAVTLHSDLDEPEAALAQYVPNASIDYSSVSGPDSADIPVEIHRANLATFLPGFDKRMHQVTNFDIRIDGDTAVSRAQCRAIHVLDGEVWLVHGTYHHRLTRTPAGWRIAYQRADKVYEENAHLVARAKQVVLDRQAAADRTAQTSASC